MLAEASVAARFEQARSVSDVLLRRTRLGLLAGRRLVEDPARVRAVAETMGSELGWDDARVTAAVGGWLATVEEEGLVTGAAAVR